MSKKKSVLVTGALGGIGKAICKKLSSDYQVIGVDKGSASKDFPGIYMSFDLSSLGEDKNRIRFLKELKRSNANIVALVNNAAVQNLSRTKNISAKAWKESLDVNLSAPFYLSQLCLADLEKNKGCIINIASIHSKLTKKAFVAYASAKAGLVGLTQALAVDLGENNIRVNCISPAAIQTPMLEAGFKNNKKALFALKKCHPLDRLGSPEEIAELCHFLISPACPFLSGSNIEIHGGVGARLHDPQ